MHKGQETFVRMHGLKCEDRHAVDLRGQFDYLSLCRRSQKGLKVETEVLNCLGGGYCGGREYAAILVGHDEVRQPDPAMRYTEWIS